MSPPSVLHVIPADKKSTFAFIKKHAEEMCVAQRVSGGDENHPKSTAGCTGCTNLFRG